MIDFERLLREPRRVQEPVPAQLIGVTGHRPDKLPNKETGYECGNPVRCWLRREVEAATAAFVADPPPSRDDTEAWFVERHLAAVAWRPQWADGAWRRIPVLGVTGGAIGTDQDAAGAWRRMSIPYIVAAPFQGQELVWPKPAQAVYAKVLECAAGIVYVSSLPTGPDRQQAVRDAMGERNQWIAGSDRLIAVYDGSKGGTRDCLYRWGDGKPRIIDPRECPDYPR